MSRWQRDRLDRKATERDFERILLILTEVRHVWDDAVDGGVWSPRTENGGRGTGFSDLRPTESAVFSPTRRQLRQTAKQSAQLIAESRERLEEAADVLHSGLFRSDPEVLARFLEKRAAATQGRPRMSEARDNV